MANNQVDFLESRLSYVPLVKRRFLDIFEYESVEESFYGLYKFKRCKFLKDLASASAVYAKGQEMPEICLEISFSNCDCASNLYK